VYPKHAMFFYTAVAMCFTLLEITGPGKKIEMYLCRLAGGRSIQRGTLAKAGLTPAVKDPVD
jgi:hypothetical protein